MELAVRHKTPWPIAASGSLAGAPECPVVTLPLERAFIGIYDPAPALAGPVDAEEVFVQWKPSVAGEIRSHIRRLLGLRRVPLVTLEPYPSNTHGLGAQTPTRGLASRPH